MNAAAQAVLYFKNKGVNWSKQGVILTLAPPSTSPPPLNGPYARIRDSNGGQHVRLEIGFVALTTLELMSTYVDMPLRGRIVHAAYKNDASRAFVLIWDAVDGPPTVAEVNP